MHPDTSHPLGDKEREWYEEILGLPLDESPEQLAYEREQALKEMNQNQDVAMWESINL